MEDVAREAGVSRALVSLVMRDQPNVGAARRQRVLEAARHLGYRPNAMARSLASHRTRAIGVMLDDLRNPFFAEIVAGIEQLASEGGYQLLLAAGRRDPSHERAAVRTLLEYRVDGLILLSPRMASADIVSVAEEVPLVVTGREVKAARAGFVVTDERRGVELVLDHLVGLGHRRITHIDGGGGAGASLRRVNYTRGMRQRGLADSAAIVPGEFTDHGGWHATQALIESGQLPTAVFAANDLIAAGVLGALQEVGLSVPREVSVVGYDNIAIAGLATISLTTVDQPRTQIGRTALRLLMERVDGQTERSMRRIEPTLVVRTTSAPPRPATREPESLSAAVKQVDP